jgi:hypothetical protein
LVQSFHVLKAFTTLPFSRPFMGFPAATQAFHALSRLACSTAQPALYRLGVEPRRAFPLRFTTFALTIVQPPVWSAQADPLVVSRLMWKMRSGVLPAPEQD